MASPAAAWHPMTHPEASEPLPPAFGQCAGAVLDHLTLRAWAVAAHRAGLRGRRLRACSTTPPGCSVSRSGTSTIGGAAFVAGAAARPRGEPGDPGSARLVGAGVHRLGARRGLLGDGSWGVARLAEGPSPLPEVLRIDEAAAVMRAAGEDATPLGLRDAAIVELLYATGARVSELCGLDVDDLDAGRQAARVLGKGAKERTVPLGEPAVAAVGAWLARGRPDLATASTADRLCSSARGAAGSTRVPPAGRSPSPRRRPRRSRSGSSRAAAYGGDAPTRGWRGPQKRSGTTRPRYARHYADLHTCVNRATKGHV